MIKLVFYIWCFLLGVMLGIGFAPKAHSAEVIMPVKVRIIRCVTQQERVHYCQTEGKCCHLIEPETNEEEDSKDVYE